MGNDSAPGGFSGLVEQITKWFIPFIAVALFVFGFRKGVKEAQEHITWAVAAAVVVGVLFLYWVYTSETERESGEAIDTLSKLEKVPRFPKLRRWAFAGMIFLPLLTIFGFVVAENIERRASNKIIVLVADFQGPDQKDPVTPAVINKLRLGAEEFSAKEFLEVEIKGLGMTIAEQEGSATAREKGKEKKASIVIWGSYDDALTGAVHIETLGEQRQLTSQYISARTSRYVGGRTSRYVGRRRNREQADYSASVVNKPGLMVKESLAGDMSLITLLLAGFIYYESEDYDQAIRRFSRALEQKTSAHLVNYQSDLLFFRGISFSFKGDFDSAISDYNQAINLKPDDADVYKYRGDAYYDKGRHDLAIADYGRAIKLKPDYADAYNNRGDAYFDRGHDYRVIAAYDKANAAHDLAIADYDQAIKLKLDYAYAYNGRGIVYYDHGRYDRAIADYNQAIKLKLDYADAYINRGSAYRWKEQLDRAIADCDQAIKLEPDYALAYYHRGDVYEKVGNKHSAIADFRKSLELYTDPRDRKDALDRLSSLGVKAE